MQIALREYYNINTRMWLLANSSQIIQMASLVDR